MVLSEAVAVGQKVHDVVPDPFGLRGWGLGVVAAPVEGTRTAIADSVRGMLGGEDPAELGLFSEPVGDPGWFGPDSVTWRIHSDVSMFIGGIRALLLQTVHPLAMAGVAEHSNYEEDPLGRLQRTGGFVAHTTFGSVETAEAAVAMVQRVHSRVKGTAPDGRPYDAQDPDLLLWVHCAEIDSFRRTYQLYGAERLRHREVDAYISETAVVAEALGSSRAPRSRVEMRKYFLDVEPELKVGRQARDAARWVLNPPLPAEVKPAYAVLASAAVLSLPGWVRRHLLILIPPLAEPLAVKPAAQALMATLRWALGAESPLVEVARARATGLDVLEAG